MVRRTKEAALETREQILDAAEWCFRTQGTSGATLDMIAQRAHCTRGAIYWHFREPSDILQAVLERGQWSLLDQLEALTYCQRDVLVNLRACLMRCLHEVQVNTSKRYSLEILAYRCDFSRDHAKFLALQREDIAHMMKLLSLLMEHAKERGELLEGLSCPSAASLIGYALVGGLRVHLMHPDVIDIKHSVMSGLDVAFSAIES
ncbi:TetR family transcriptional regulator [Citrobacter amalonaticus]|uniref:TetR family transcriptional regulator n=1 Tax=Citrobacter amalonaticus TaxID=35703 RepID=UPI002FE5F05B